MSTYKNHRLLASIKEFDKAGSKYQINGIDQGKAIFFARKPKEMFEPIPKGSYRIVNEGGSVYLEIIDSTLLSEIERIQVCYEIASMSSTYDVEYNVDVNILKNRYNEAVRDIKALFDFVKKNLFLSDSQDVLAVLPQLDVDEVYVKTIDGWRGFNIGSLEANIKAQIDEFKKLVTESFSQFEDKKNEYLAELESVKDGQEEILDNYLNQNLDRVKAEGDLQVSRVTLTGTEQDNKVTNTGNFQYERLSDLIAQTGIDTKLIIINQMFDVIIGSNRYLNGQSLELRDILYLDRQPDGRSLSTRKDLRSSYDGGLLSNRTVTIPNIPTGVSHPITIDLGGAK